MGSLKQGVHKIGQRLGRTKRQPVSYEADQRWRELSEDELTQVTGRQESMSRAEAVLRLRLMGFDGFPDASSTNRSWTHLFRYLGPMYLTVGVSDEGFGLSWSPSLLPGGDFLLAMMTVEGWVEEQDCLNELAAIAACDSNLSQSLSGLKVEGVPIARGMAALDAFCRVMTRIFPNWPDLNEVVTKQAVDRAIASASKNTVVMT